ncbi:MAG: hypothetical protein ACRDE2_10650 [Chitinophagaceae bacterium]
MSKVQIISLLKYAAISGNILFIIWVSHNAMEAHFAGTIYERLSYIGLMGLLSVNSLLLWTNKAQKNLKI